MKKIFIYIVLFSFFTANSSMRLYGQKKTVDGIVTTFDSIPVIGAKIESVRTDEVVYSDSTGMFRITCGPTDKLKIAAGGFAVQNVQIKEKTKFVLVNLTLIQVPADREMAVGYGHVKASDRLYAISGISENELDFSKYRTIHEVISEQFVSIRIKNDGTLVIRNAEAITDDNSALLIVDGREVDVATFGNLNTVDIASINVLKDASASVYGSRGANGVVIVETKRGE